MSHISTHVLDTAEGKPAVGVPIRLEQLCDSGWVTLSETHTNADGRVPSLSPTPLPAARYRLTAEIGAWFAAQQRQTIYPQAQIDVVIPRAGEHFHLPFLITPWSWSTYRGS